MVDAQSEGKQHRPTLADGWVARLEGRRPRVPFADGEDARVREAAQDLIGLGLRPVLVSDSSLAEVAPGVDVLSLAELAAGPVGQEVQDTLRERGLSEDVASLRRLDPTFLSTRLTRRGDTQATVAGSARPTSDALRAGL